MVAFRVTIPLLWTVNPPLPAIIPPAPSVKVAFVTVITLLLMVPLKRFRVPPLISAFPCSTKVAPPSVRVPAPVLFSVVVVVPEILVRTSDPALIAKLLLVLPIVVAAEPKSSIPPVTVTLGVLERSSVVALALVKPLLLERVDDPTM